MPIVRDTISILRGIVTVRYAALLENTCMIAKLIAAITMLMVGLAFLGIAALCIVLFLASRRPSPAAESERVSRIEDIHGISAAALRPRYSVCDEAELVLLEAWYKDEVQE